MKLYGAMVLTACVWILQVIWNWSLLICRVWQVRCLHHTAVNNMAVNIYFYDVHHEQCTVAFMVVPHPNIFCLWIEWQVPKRVKVYHFVQYKLLYQVFYSKRNRERVSDVCLELDTNVLLGTAGGCHQHFKIHLLPRNEFSAVLDTQLFYHSSLSVSVLWSRPTTLDLLPDVCQHQPQADF